MFSKYLLKIMDLEGSQHMDLELLVIISSNGRISLRLYSAYPERSKGERQREIRSQSSLRLSNPL